MIESKTISDDVDLKEIAALTKNYSGAELAELILSAQSCAFARHTKGPVAVTVEDVDGIQVCRNDFMVGIENDIKPAYGSTSGVVDKYIRNGILMWGMPVQHVLDQGSLLANQVYSNPETPLLSILLSGASGSGKSALAVRIAIDSGFPFVKVCSPDDLIGLSEGAKCQHIETVLTDAYKSKFSCVVIDDIEKLMDYNPIGPRFSNTVAQALTSLVKRLPPVGHKLLVIATSSHLSVLQDMNINESFKRLVHVENLSHAEHINEVLEGLDAFTTTQRGEIERLVSEYKIDIGIKQLIDIVGTAKQMEPSQQVSKFMSLLAMDGRLQSSNGLENLST